MISRSLRRTQETKVLQAITAVHLNPYAFDWELVESLECSEAQVPRLFHSSRKYSFLFDVKDPDGYVVVFRPGVNHRLRWSWEDGSVCSLTFRHGRVG